MKGLYIHVPFCKKRCYYCNFYTHAGLSHLHESYFRALCKEISTYEGDEFDTIYIGGGTPNFVKVDLIAKLLEHCRKVLKISEDAEITIECNPGILSRADILRFKLIGINRISLGMQSSFDMHLKVLGRTHTYENILVDISRLSGAGFNNISVDLMYGIPDQTVDNWIETLAIVSDLSVKHISCYPLSIEPETPLYGKSLSLPNENEVRLMYEFAVEFLAEEGFDRYEICNFSVKGYESKHNLKYWCCEEYVGIGASAHSFVNNIRYLNKSDLLLYINSQDATDQVEEISLKERMSEFVILGLRLNDGIDEEKFKERFGCSIFEPFKQPLEQFIKEKKMIHKNGKIYMRDDLFFVSNFILSEFILNY